MTVWQTPEPLHSWLLPHAVPVATFVEVSPHTDAPVEHEVAPVLHGFGLVEHVVPAVQALQMPVLLQT